MTQAPVTQLQPRAAPAPLEFANIGALQPGSLRGAQILAATLEPVPELGYYFSWLAEEAKKRVIEGTAEYAADLFFKLWDTMQANFGLIRPSPQKRLDFYRYEKTPQMWQEQMAKYPNDYQDDIKDYNALLKRVEQGTLI